MKKTVEESAEELAEFVLRLMTDDKLRKDWEKLLPYDENRSHSIWVNVIKGDRLSKETLYSMIAWHIVSLGDIEGAIWYEDLMLKAKKGAENE